MQRVNGGLLTSCTIETTNQRNMFPMSLIKTLTSPPQTLVATQDSLLTLVVPM
ncbi:hypothetical protein DPMN_146791 [Dreissena polymorpha]|uniref:Uncharacterized protein n=1 Tax=Dreissena polymorpha TaxID=45954 RepID=A0A9D4F6H8_DREPO|nr:hypothetical protein DPMN_146791 [Dreissena polymorpha]